MYPIFKRVFDLCFVIITAPFWVSVFVIVSVAIYIKMGRPILFMQRRGGYKGKPISILKFRTMTNAKDATGHFLPDDERLTRFGKFLRSSSLDEIPSLICVLTGQISLVGPRPFIYDYIPLYSAEQMRRHDVRPGITGWAQVNGRNTLSWEEKFALDVWYVDNQSLWLDVKILFLTIQKVFKRADISADGEATMPRWTGSK